MRFLSLFLGYLYGYIGKFILITTVLVISNIVVAKDIHIALRANEDAQKVLSQWQATADYLTKTIPNHRFILTLFPDNGTLNQAVSSGKFSFCITNPSAFIEHKVRYGAVALATLLNKRQGQGYDKFGSVIFTRADRTDINTLQDIKGKTFVAVDELGFGGWRVAWRELLKNDINPYTDFKELRFAGGQHQNVILAVKEKGADVGSVRTDMLERLAMSGDIDLADFKVLGDKQTAGFPFLHSSQLYPEWSLSAGVDVSDKLKKQVSNALFSIQSESEAAISGQYVGWISPVNYQPVEDLLKELKVGPYDLATMDWFDRLLNQYAMGLLLLSLLIAVLSVSFIFVLNFNRRLVNAQALLKIEMQANETLEHQLMHMQSIESLGQLTGGIAHNFNNILASMLGFTELCLASDAVKNNDKVRNYLEQVILSGKKGAILIDQMLTFSHVNSEIDKVEITSVSQIIIEQTIVCHQLLPSSIELSVTQIDEDLKIKVNQTMLGQVLMNLCLNARDAIDDNIHDTSNDVITISAKLTLFDEIECQSCHHSFSGEFVVIEIKDSGCGFDEKTKVHLFDPFYTTKEVGKGTGLGLAMVHGIIHKHDGHILVDTQLGKGTTIKILLPQSFETTTSTKRKAIDKEEDCLTA